jgi:hypothetical protein
MVNFWAMQKFADKIKTTTSKYFMILIKGANIRDYKPLALCEESKVYAFNSRCQEKVIFIAPRRDFLHFVYAPKCFCG